MAGVHPSLLTETYKICSLLAGVHASVCSPWSLWLLTETWRVSTWFLNSREPVGAETWWKASAHPSLKMGKPSCSPLVCTFFWRPWYYGKWVFLKVPGCFCTVTKLSINLSLTSTTSLFPPLPIRKPGTQCWPWLLWLRHILLCHHLHFRTLCHLTHIFLLLSLVDWSMHF